MYLNGNPQTTTSAPLLLKVQPREFFFFFNSSRSLIFRRIYLSVRWREETPAISISIVGHARAKSAKFSPCSSQEVVGDGIFEQTLDHVSRANNFSVCRERRSLGGKGEGEEEKKDRSVAFCVQAMRTRTCSEWHWDNSPFSLSVYRGVRLECISLAASRSRYLSLRFAYTHRRHTGYICN